MCPFYSCWVCLFETLKFIGHLPASAVFFFFFWGALYDILNFSCLDMMNSKNWIAHGASMFMS